MKKTILLFIVSITLLACKKTNDSTNIIEEETNLSSKDSLNILTTPEVIANKNGLESWAAVSEINFTFNVDRGESHFERSWTWNPKSNQVIATSKTDTIHYNRNNLDSLLLSTDAAFINDKYWLLAPFNLVWDTGFNYSEKENIIAPISKDTLNKLTIVYNNEGGYTPGDAYDFYYGNDFIIREWTYRKGNDSLPSLITTWEDYQVFNELNIAKTHKDSTGNFKLYFTNISVKK